MKNKFKKFFKRSKRIISKIVADKQLLTIFTLMLLVIIIGCIVIGVLRTFIIIGSLILISFLIRFILKKKQEITTNKKKEDNKKKKKDGEEENEDEVEGEEKEEAKEDIKDEEHDEVKSDTISESSDNSIMIKKKKKAEKKKSHKKNDKKKVWNTIITIVLVLMLLGILLAFAFAGYVVISAPNFNPSNLYRKESSIMYDKDGNTIAKLGSEIRKTITYDQMPQVLVEAIIATEDSRFYQHNGVDLPRFTKAVIGQLLHKSGAGGGSTITMQVSKNAYTSGVRNGFEGIVRKFTDIYLAVFKLERNYTKDQILEYYVNIPGLGSNSFGVAEASETYFGKDVSELNLSEAALIAGLFQAPTAYNPYLHPEAAAERRAVVLNLMVRHGYITREEADMANAISVESLLGTKSYTNPYQNFIDVAIDEIYEKTGENPYNTPMKIYTTLDKEKQDYLNKVIEGEVYTWVNDTVQTGIAVTDVENGGIVAISGGRNTVAMGLNRATDLKNQLGSAAKPLFDYGPGVEYNNWSTYTPFIDEPWSYSSGGGAIKNWDSNFYGFLTLRRSLGLSRNIPALKAFQNVGNNKIYSFVTSLGITPEMEGGSVHEAHALGSFNGTNPLEVAAAYAAFANGGYYIKPYTVTKIVYMGTNQTKEYKPSKTKVMEDSSAYIITNSLIWAVDAGLSAGARIAGRQVAAKTSTTNFDDRTLRAFNLPYNAIKDYWVAGYTPKIAMAVWYGYDKITDGYNTTADNSRKDRLFNTVMKGMLSDSPKNFTIPKSIVAVQVETGTIPAMLPSDNTPKDMISTEYFKAGTEPTEISPRYLQLNNPNGLTVSTENKMATLSWKEVNMPAYYTESWMNSHIKDGMGDTAQNYIEYRKEEIEKLGEFGYDIYIVDSTGNEKLVTTTTDTTAKVDISKYTGDIKFIVKTAWSIDKTTQSSGSEYTVVEEKPLSIVSVSLRGDATMNLKVNDIFNDPLVTVLDNFKDVTSESDISYTITNSNKEMLSEVDTSTADTYTIKYKVVYNENTYEQTRIVIVKEVEQQEENSEQ